MKAIILAAGRGTRLAPLTDTVPKCMVKYRDKTLIRYILDAYSNCNISNITIVGGYKMEVLKRHLADEQINFCFNKEFATTNMVYSLFCAASEFNDDLIISYSDIIYGKRTLETLMADNSPIAVVVDKKWKELWMIRMEYPLDDVESLKLGPGNNIIELGKKPRSEKEIQGQYIGLLKIKKEALNSVRDFYNLLDKKAIYDGKDFNNMFMTTFVQSIINKLMPVKAVPIEGGWLEIDSLTDLERYNRRNYVPF